MPQAVTPEPAGTAIPESTQPPAAQPEAKPADASAPKPEDPKPAVPPLTPQEFRIYNRLAETMDYFHDHFRQMYTTLHSACTTGRRPSNMTLKHFIDEGLRLAHYLETHHSIEETHLYPLLARKMPEFRSSVHSPSSSSSASGKGGGGEKAGGKKRKKTEECELLRQHQIIHEGMDDMAEYLKRCKNRECELELAVLKEKLDSWGEVLLRHLDQEVRDLGAEKMRRYWSVAEMRAFPI
ncbi:hypothetical protein VTI74DRAFT_4185 [Chaetomium olivicolor]